MRKAFFVLAILVLLLAACGGGGGAAPAPAAGGASVANGEKLFKQTVIGAQAGCITCHSLDGSKLVGPSMKGLATRAATEVSGLSAEEYIRQSILEPNAHVVKDYPAGVMQSYKNDLKEQELNDLVAYLLTLK
ncbi:MAG: cytochrome c [Anaerolineae bacterium]|nr:cytochrome c [Anaerolineae bacterium]